ncbi:MAG: hypothetical protein ACREQ4_05700 [Candidatus Binataceae bacterium]
MRSRSFSAAWRVTIIAGLLIAGCAARQAPSVVKTRTPNRFIYVSAQGLPGECYRDLGTLKFNESFGDASVDQNGSAAANRLRSLALETYPNTVDAVIDVRSLQNDIGTTVTVTGEAVELQNHETTRCMLRKMPGIIDNTAAVAAGGMAGTLAGGLITNRVEGAMAGAGVGGTAVGSYELNKSRMQAQLQKNQIRNELAEQQRQILHLQAERAHLRQCQQQEMSLADCDAEQVSQSQTGLGTAADESINSRASAFELKKQIEEQTGYISQLQGQVSDLRRQMGGY